MREKRTRHALQLMFPLTVLSLFLLCAMLVLLLASRVYGSTTGRQRSAEQRSTPLAYLAEKLRQADEGGCAAVVTVEGRTCLELRGSYGGAACITRIFEQDGELMELFTPAAAEVSLGGAQRVMEVSGLQLEEPEEGLFHFSVTDESGGCAELWIGERSGA